MNFTIGFMPAMVIKGVEFHYPSIVINATGQFAEDGFNHSHKPGALPRGYVVYALPEK